HLRERLAAPPGDVVEGADRGEVVVAQKARAPRGGAAGRAAVGRYAREVLVGEETLGQRREADAANALCLQPVEEAVLLDPAVQHRVARLVENKGRAESPKDGGRLRRAPGTVGRYAGIEGFPPPDRGIERAHRLIERRVRIDPVRI